jgi:hypothetical protein
VSFAAFETSSYPGRERHPNTGSAERRSTSRPRVLLQNDETVEECDEEISETLQPQLRFTHADPLLEHRSERHVETA